MGLPVVLIRGAGDLASGVAVRLQRAGFHVLMTEVARPLAVRRRVSFSEAVFSGETFVEDIPGVLITDLQEVLPQIDAHKIPVIVDPDLSVLKQASLEVYFPIIVDARLLKREVPPIKAELVIGLGPGFVPGLNCDCVVETMRGHRLGRVSWDQPALENTGLPDGNPDRVLRAGIHGVLHPKKMIAERVERGDQVALIEGDAESVPVIAQVSGVLRGLLRDGMQVSAGMKIGDIDERGDPSYCDLVSDKSLAIGGGVLEAILTRRKLFPGLI